MGDTRFTWFKSKSSWKRLGLWHQLLLCAVKWLTLPRNMLLVTAWQYFAGHICKLFSFFSWTLQIVLDMIFRHLESIQTTPSLSQQPRKLVQRNLLFWSLLEWDNGWGPIESTEIFIERLNRSQMRCTGQISNTGAQIQHLIPRFHYYQWNLYKRMNICRDWRWLNQSAWFFPIIEKATCRSSVDFGFSKSSRELLLNFALLLWTLKEKYLCSKAVA